MALMWMRFLNSGIFKTVQVRCTPSLLSLVSSRTVGRLRCSTARRSLPAARSTLRKKFQAPPYRVAGSSVAALKGADGVPSIISLR